MGDANWTDYSAAVTAHLAAKTGAFAVICVRVTMIGIGTAPKVRKDILMRSPIP